VVSTRIGLNPRAQDQKQFVIDFNVPDLTNEDDPPQIATTCSTNGTIVEADIYRNNPEKTWRVFLNMLPVPGDQSPVDMTCVLKKNDKPVSETWAYRWSLP
jgi:glucan biosynthesis protein